MRRHFDNEYKTTLVELLPAGKITSMIRENNKICQSMSRKGNCLDNAFAEESLSKTSEHKASIGWICIKWGAAYLLNKVYRLVQYQKDPFNFGV